MVAKKRKAPQFHQTTLRHVWLASLGLAVVAQREAAALPRRLLADGRYGVHEGLATARAQVEPKVVRFSSAVERRLAPVLVKFGLKPAARPTPKARKMPKAGPRQIAARKATPVAAKGRRRAG